MADIQRLLDSMATTPDIYFCDAWEDALMGDVLRYLVTKMSGCWSPAADRVISICCHGQSLPLKRLRQTLLDRLASGTFFSAVCELLLESTIFLMILADPGPPV